MFFLRNPRFIVSQKPSIELDIICIIMCLSVKLMKINIHEQYLVSCAKKSLIRSIPSLYSASKLRSVSQSARRNQEEWALPVSQFIMTGNVRTQSQTTTHYQGLVQRHASLWRSHQFCERIILRFTGCLWLANHFPSFTSFHSHHSPGWHGWSHCKSE